MTIGAPIKIYRRRRRVEFIGGVPAAAPTSAPSAPQKWEHCRWWLTQISDSVSASLFPFLRICIAAGEPASSSVSSHSLNHIKLSSWVLAARSKPFGKLKPCFHSGRREWQSPRMGRLALSPEEHASALSAQRRQQKLCPNFFLHNLHTRTLATR